MVLIEDPRQPITNMLEDRRPSVPTKSSPFLEQVERSQYRIVSWHLNPERNFWPEYLVTDVGNIQLTYPEVLLEYILKAGFCYAAATPWHLECLMKILGDFAVGLAKEGRADFWHGYNNYSLKYSRTRYSASLNVQSSSRYGSIHLVEWLMPTMEERLYGEMVDFPDQVSMGSVNRIIQKVYSALRQDFRILSPNLTFAGSLISQLMKVEAPWLFNPDNDVMEAFNQIGGGGDFETIEFGGDSLQESYARDKNSAVASIISTIPKYAVYQKDKRPARTTRDLPKDTFHGFAPIKYTLNPSLDRGPIPIRKNISGRPRIIDAVGGEEMKMCSFADLKILDRHPEWGKYEILDAGLWVVPLDDECVFSDMEGHLFEYKKDPDLVRFAKQLQYASYGVFGKKHQQKIKIATPSLPLDKTIPKSLLDNGYRMEWMKYFMNIPRFEEVRTGSFSTVASSIVTSKLSAEVRELGIITKANSTRFDCVDDIRGTFPSELADEEKLGKYKESRGEPFYVTDLERGLVYLKDSLEQKGGAKLQHLVKTRVSLVMVGKRKPKSNDCYTLDEVGTLQDSLEDINLGSSRRVNNPNNTDELIAGKKSKPFILGKNNYSDLKYGIDFELEI